MFFLWVFTICFFWKMIGPDEVQWQRIFGMLVCMDEEVWKVNKRPVSRGFRWVLTFYHVQTAVLFAGKWSKTWHPTCNGGLHGAGGSGQWSQIWSTWRPSSLCVTKLNQIGKARAEGAQQCRMWWGGKCPLLQHQVLPVGNWKVIFWSRGCDTWFCPCLQNPGHPSRMPSAIASYAFRHSGSSQNSAHSDVSEDPPVPCWRSWRKFDWRLNCTFFSCFFWGV